MFLFILEIFYAHILPSVLLFKIIYVLHRNYAVLVKKQNKTFHIKIMLNTKIMWDTKFVAIKTHLKEKLMSTKYV